MVSSWRVASTFRRAASGTTATARRSSDRPSGQPSACRPKYAHPGLSRQRLVLRCPYHASSSFSWLSSIRVLIRRSSRNGNPKFRSQRQRVQPELRRLVIAVDMHMRRFVRLMTEEIHAVRTAPQNRWHRGILPHNEESLLGALARQRADELLGSYLRGLTPLLTRDLFVDPRMLTITIYKY